jgi:hypothetical protein
MCGSMNFHAPNGASIYYNRTSNSLAMVHNDFINGVRAETIDSVDFYKFTLDGPASFPLTMDRMRSDADVQLLDANGQVIIGSYAGGSSSELVDMAIDAGQYYVRVFPYTGSPATG